MELNIAVRLASGIQLDEISHLKDFLAIIFTFSWKKGLGMN